MAACFLTLIVATSQLKVFPSTSEQMNRQQGMNPMNTALRLCLFGLLLGSASLPGAQTAQARFYCLSLRFRQGSDAMGFYTLDLSTLPSPAVANGELAPTFSQPTHSSGFRLTDVFWEVTAEGALAIGVPMAKDENQNGYADFFEVSQSASGTTVGSFVIPGVDSGTVQAAWSRAAGAKDGSCVIQMTGGSGPLSAFTHEFELVEYLGPLSYTPGINRVAGSVDLRQTGVPDNRFAGAVEFVNSSTKPHNRLELQPGSWTNAWDERFVFQRATYLRDPGWPTNYYGYLEFDDGDSYTSEPDYYDWMLSLDDLNDSDRDGIPNFSDSPASTQPRTPRLAVSFTPTEVRLSLSGTAGVAHEVQEASSLSLRDWSTVRTVTLTNDPAVVTLPIPVGRERFWRVRVPAH